MPALLKRGNSLEGSGVGSVLSLNILTHLYPATVVPFALVVYVVKQWIRDVRGWSTPSSFFHSSSKIPHMHLLPKANDSTSVMIEEAVYSRD